MATNHDILSHSERVGRIVEVQRILENARKVATSTEQKFSNRMSLADNYVTWEELWDDVYTGLNISRQLASQAKVLLDNLLGSVTDGVDFYPGFLFQAVWEVGKGGIAKMVLTDGGGSDDTIHFTHEDASIMSDSFACASNTHTASGTMLDVNDKIVVEGTATQDGFYTVKSCTDSTITLNTGSLPTAATENCTTAGASIKLLRRNFG